MSGEQENQDDIVKEMWNKYKENYYR
jgi:hypothetical protein